MGTQPDWRADPTLSMPTVSQQPADPWSDHPFPYQFPQPGHVPGMPAPGYAGQPDSTLAEPTRPEPWRGAAPVRPPKPAPVEMTSTAVDPVQVAVTGKPRMKPYLTPGLPTPRQAKAWKVGGWWSTWGVFFAFCCWGTWAISHRGSVSSVILLGTFPVILAVGLLAFLVSRMIGRVLMDSWRTQPRKTAKLAHFITFVYFVLAGIGYLRMTTWIIDGLNWLETVR